MKLYVLFALLFIAAALAQEDTTEEGQPGCTTDREMEKKYIRNRADPKTYWECEERGKPATLVKCPEGTVFINSRRQCADPGLLSGLPLPDLPLPDIFGNRN